MKFTQGFWIVLSVLFLSYPALAQTKSDYTFEKVEFSGLKAEFWENNNNFKLINGKKSRMIPLAKSDSLTYLNAIALNKKLKISAQEAFFIQLALPEWEKAKMKIGFTFEENGLGIKIIEQGKGELPKEGQIVMVHYTGKLEDGTVFDSSVPRNTPFEFPLGKGRVIKGWDLGIAQLPIGTKAVLWIPADLAYGNRGAGSVIGPGATLFFEVELLGIK
jgi:FKBP-type peptidyl-prolyl cis-trans isomerase